MRSLLCVSRGNHYILYFTSDEYLKSSHFREMAVGNSPGPYPARGRGIHAALILDGRPSPEPMPPTVGGKGAAIVHSLWTGVEAVDKRLEMNRISAGKRSGLSRQSL